MSASGLRRQHRIGSSECFDRAETVVRPPPAAAKTAIVKESLRPSDIGADRPDSSPERAYSYPAPKLTGNGVHFMTNYRVSKAQSLRMRAADMKAEAAEARKAKAAEKKKAKADKEAGGPKFLTRGSIEPSGVE
jgi:hypothetical protein